VVGKADGVIVTRLDFRRGRLKSFGLGKPLILSSLIGTVARKGP